MEEFKGTKGEWEILRDETDIGSLSISTEEAYVCNIDIHEESEANAKLITAAPDLLKALQLVQYGYMQQTKHNNLSDDYKGIHNMVNKAINKALGYGV